MLPLSLAVSVFRRYGGPLAVAAAMLGAGWWALSAAEQRGWDRRDAQVKAQELQDVRKELKTAVESAVTDQRVTTQIEVANQVATTRAKTLNQHLARQERNYTPKAIQGATHDPVPDPQQPTAQLDVARPLLGHAVLDAFTVRLLNDARAGAAPDIGPPASAADAEGEASASTPTTVTGGDFADNDLEVVRLYQELATRHNELVDWVKRQSEPAAGEQSPPTH